MRLLVEVVSGIDLNIMNIIHSLLTAFISKFRYFSILIGFAFLLFSCGKPVDHSKFIPREASLVLCFNLDSLDNKAPNWQILFNKDMPILNIKRDYEFGRALKASGIDFQSPIYFFSDVSKTNLDTYYALCFKLKDESRFDRFLKNLPNQKLNIGSFSGMRYTMLDNKTILGWVNKIAMVISKPSKTDETVLKDKLLRLRDLPDKQSLRKNNTQFQQVLLNADYDIASWMNLDVFNEDVQSSLRKFLPPLNIDLDIKDNYLTATGQFRDEELQLFVNLYNENKAFGEYQNIVKNEIDTNFLARLPIQKPLSMFSVGLNMEGVEVILDNFWWNIFRQQAIALPDTTLQDMLGMLSGDVAGVLQDIRKVAEQEEDKYNYDYLISLGIQEKETLDKLMNEYRENGALFLVDSTVFYAPNIGIYLIEQGNSLLITPSDSIKNQLLKGSKQRISANLAALGDQSFFVLYSDVQEKTRQKIPPVWFGEDRMLEGLVQYVETPIESIALNTLPTQENVSRTEIILKFKEKDQNTLQTLLEALTEAVREDQSPSQIRSK